MLSFDSVKLRLEREHELSFLEFNYMILQAYDYVELARRYGCNLQMGGSDQWGNIVNGIDLGRRLGTHQLYALTCPLLTTASGAKMGKTASGAVWLNADMLSPLGLLAVLAQHRRRRCGPLHAPVHPAAHGGDCPLRGARRCGDQRGQEKKLADEATALMHGREAAEQAAETARQTFEQGKTAASLPTVTIPSNLIEQGLSVLAAFGPDHAGLTGSMGEGRRQIKAGGLRVNDTVVTDERLSLTGADWDRGRRGQALPSQKSATCWLKAGMIVMI